jgi:hypothetical protein
MSRDQIETADRMAWGRVRAANAMAAVLLGTQAASFRDSVDPANPHSPFFLTTWVIWIVLMLFFFAAGGGLIRGRALRPLLQDESTREHRRRAEALSFWVMAGVTVVLYLANGTLNFTTGEVLRLVLTAGVATALFRFSTLERKALRVS